VIRGVAQAEAAPRRGPQQDDARSIALSPTSRGEDEPDEPGEPTLDHKSGACASAIDLKQQTAPAGWMRTGAAR
jgi:hypothetical protein